MSDLEACMSDCDAFFAEAKKWYQAICIPGELNTRVRAAIESDYEKKKTVQMISGTDVNDSEHIRQFNLSVNKQGDTL